MEIANCKMENAKFKMGKAPEHRRTPRRFRELWMSLAAYAESVALHAKARCE